MVEMPARVRGRMNLRPFPCSDCRGQAEVHGDGEQLFCSAKRAAASAMLGMLPPRMGACPRPRYLLEGRISHAGPKRALVLRREAARLWTCTCGLS